MKRASLRSVTGFTLVEMVIVVAIIGILSAIAYPSYQQYVLRTKRTAMMVDLQNIANRIEAQKLAQGNYSTIDRSRLGLGSYPKDSTPLYTVNVSDPLTRTWTLSAVPIVKSQMQNDGTLTLDYQGIKCRDLSTTSKTDKRCGTGEEWSK